MSGPYDDILELPHHVSSVHPPMRDRAAQFAPFAALTGLGAAMRETARRTGARPELDESEKAALNEKLVLLQENLEDSPAATFTFYQADARKEGGACRVITDRVKKTDEYRRLLILRSGYEIPIDDILEISF